MKNLPLFLRKPIIRGVKVFTPNIYRRFVFNSLKKNYTEDELYLLPSLCHPQKTSVDIGASDGLYAVHMLNYSEKCIAFEARPGQALQLRKMLALFTPNASVEGVGVSDKTGEATINVLENDLGRSTIEAGNSLEDGDVSQKISYTIKTRRLDEYNLQNVGFIKIDVEGHEIAVLNGAKETIAANLPTLLIEIEERHRSNALRDAAAFLDQFGYKGFFLLHGKITSLDQFVLEQHQNPKNAGNLQNNYQRQGIYINNFIFIPGKQAAAFIAKTEKITYDRKG